MAWQVYRTHFLLCETVPLFPGPYPGVRRSRRRKPGPRSLGTAAHQGKAQAVEVLSTEEQARFTECLRHLCDPIRPRAETRRTQAHPVPRGGFHKAGEGPAFGDSFPDFSSGRNRAQRSVPGWLAGLNPDLGEGHSLKKGGRTFHRLFHLSYFAYWLRPILNRSLPWLSTATVRGRFSTSMRLTDSQPSSSKAMTWAVLMHLAIRAPAPPTAAK